MAHFAQLDENNVVIRVIVVNNNELMDGADESEAKGISFCQSLYGADTRWVQTSYNGNFRKRYAGVGFLYDPVLDIFIAPRHVDCPDFVFDPITTEWVPPIPRPTDTVYRWDFVTKTWNPLPQPYPSWTAQGNPLGWTPPVPYPKNGKNYRWDEPTLSWIEVM
jgi:hypothetical protein